MKIGAIPQNVNILKPNKQHLTFILPFYRIVSNIYINNSRLFMTIGYLIFKKFLKLR